MIRKKDKKSEFPKYFLENKTMITEDQDIAECFNNFFISIGPDLSNKIKPPEGKCYKDFLTKHIESSFEFERINENDVLKIIHKLKQNQVMDTIMYLQYY